MIELSGLYLPPLFNGLLMLPPDDLMSHKLASIKARPASSHRMTASQVEELLISHANGSLPPSPSASNDSRSPKVYASVAEMKKAKVTFINCPIFMHLLIR